MPGDSLSFNVEAGYLWARPGAWTTRNPLSLGIRREATAVKMASGKILIIGGTNVNTFTGQGALATCEIFDPATNTCTAAASMPSAHYLCGAWLLPSGRVLVACGRSTTNVASLESAEYTEGTNTWEITGNTSIDHSDAYWVSLQDGSPLIFGGSVTQNAPTNVMEKYNPTTKTWSTMTPMLTARRLHTASVLLDGRVLIVAGRTTGGGTGVGTANCEIYDPVANTVTATGAITAAMRSMAQYTLSTGHVLVAGGSIDPSVGQTAAYLWRPDTGLWSLAGSISAAKTLRHIPFYHEMSGRRIIAGGGNPGVYHDKTDAYMPHANAWITLANMNVGRHFHPQIKLNDGRIATFGGQRIDTSTVLDSVETYTESSYYGDVWPFEPQ